MIKREYFIRATKSKDLSVVDSYFTAVEEVRSWLPNINKATDKFKDDAKEFAKWDDFDCENMSIVAFNRV